tara:strand:- start:451 stop:678 length:228 start_codon:yes stop_codon:yes gene_type:complete
MKHTRMAENFGKADKIMEQLKLNKIDRERIIKEIQKLNNKQRNNIYELANLNNKELLKRLKELQQINLNNKQCKQ